MDPFEPFTLIKIQKCTTLSNPGHRTSQQKVYHAMGEVFTIFCFASELEPRGEVGVKGNFLFTIFQPGGIRVKLRAFKEDNLWKMDLQWFGTDWDSFRNFCTVGIYLSWLYSFWWFSSEPTNTTSIGGKPWRKPIKSFDLTESVKRSFNERFHPRIYSLRWPWRSMIMDRNHRSP